MPKSKKQSKGFAAKKGTLSPAFPPQPLVKPQESPAQDDHIPEPFFAVKNADGKPWRVCGRVEGSYEDEVSLNIATDPLDADGQILEDGEFNVAYFAPSDFDDKPTRKDYEKYISEKIDHAMDSANVGGVISYDKKRHDDIIRTVRQWAIRVITRSFNLDKPRQKPDTPPAPKAGKIHNSTNSAEEIIKNPLTSRIKGSIAGSKERLNFVLPFLSSFALTLLDKKTTAKITDKRLITRFDDSSLTSFDLKTLKELLKLGFEIRFDNAIHLKLYIADDDVYVTSSNFTKAGFEDNIELSVKTDSSNIPNCVAIFNEIWNNCAASTLTEDLIDKNWAKYEILREREKYANSGRASKDVSTIDGDNVLGEAGNKFGFNLENLIEEISNQGIDAKMEKLAIEANKRREELKRGMRRSRRFEYSRFYSTYGDGKQTLLYELAHGNEFQLAGTGLRDQQFLTAFKHADFEKVIAYIYPESVGMKPWNFGDRAEFRGFCNGIFDFKIPNYKEALPIRLASYFHPDYFLAIFNLKDLGEICDILSGQKVYDEDGNATLGDKLFYYNSTLADELKVLPFDNYRKSYIAYQILYAARLHKRLGDGEKYEKILNNCESKWEKDLFEKGRDLFMKLQIIE